MSKLHFTSIQKTLEKTKGVIKRWTIQRHKQHWTNKTRDEDKQNKIFNTENKNKKKPKYEQRGHQQNPGVKPGVNEG